MELVMAKEAVLKVEDKQEVTPEAPQKDEKGAKSKWSKEDLLKVFDDLMFAGEYSEEVLIKGRLKVTFRTRTAEEQVDISKFLDQSQFNLILTVQEHRALYNLRASLINYNGRDLSHVDAEEKMKFINKLNIQVVSAVSDALAQFDAKVEAACREAEENF
jgi:hypothetical protein